MFMVLMLVFMNRTWISVPCEHRDLSSHSSARLQVLVMWIQNMPNIGQVHVQKVFYAARIITC